MPETAPAALSTFPPGSQTLVSTTISATDQSVSSITKSSTRPISPSLARMR